MTTCFSTNSTEDSVTVCTPLGIWRDLYFAWAIRNMIAGAATAMNEIRAILLNPNGVPSKKASGHSTM